MKDIATNDLLDNFVILIDLLKRTRRELRKFRIDPFSEETFTVFLKSPDVGKDLAEFIFLRCLTITRYRQSVDLPQKLLEEYRIMPNRKFFDLADYSIIEGLGSWDEREGDMPRNPPRDPNDFEKLCRILEWGRKSGQFCGDIHLLQFPFSTSRQVVSQVMKRLGYRPPTLFEFLVHRIVNKIKFDHDSVAVLVRGYSVDSSWNGEVGDMIYAQDFKTYGKYGYGSGYRFAVVQEGKQEEKDEK